MAIVKMQDHLAGLKLPSNKTIPESDFRKYSLLLYGVEKVGKTSLAAEFDDAIFLSCEPGVKALNVYAVEINNWLELKQYLKLLTDDRTKFKTIIIDTVDLAYKYCEAWGCQKLGIVHLSDESWGKAWGLVKDEFHTTMSTALKLGRGVIFISHSQEKEIKERTGSRHRVGPTMGSAAEKILEPMIDIFAYYSHDDKSGRSIQIVGDDLIAAGHRIQGHFNGIKRIPGGNSAKEAYDNYVKAFNNELSSVTQPTQTGAPKLSIKKG